MSVYPKNTPTTPLSSRGGNCTGGPSSPQSSGDFSDLLTEAQWRLVGYLVCALALALFWAVIWVLDSRVFGGV